MDMEMNLIKIGVDDAMTQRNYGKCRL